jgi:hypothetical protein
METDDEWLTTNDQRQTTEPARPTFSPICPYLSTIVTDPVYFATLSNPKEDSPCSQRKSPLFTKGSAAFTASLPW